jgi:hypothetical protein
MASTTYLRAVGLPRTQVSVGQFSGEVVKDFAIFIDTHRDQPHVGMFEDDIHRGTCKPTLVHLATVKDNAGNPAYYLIRNEDGKSLKLHEKHKFVTVEWWRGWLLDQVAEKGKLPINSEGFMATSHLRDARAGRYMLKSFRQIVVHNQIKGGTR